MTASELKYLISAMESNDGGGAKMAAMAQRLGVSKVSVCRAVERLTASGYVMQNGKKILLTEKGISALDGYTEVINFIGEMLQRYCNTPEDKAFEEALGAACALGEESRKRITELAEKGASERK